MTERLTNRMQLSTRKDNFVRGQTKRNIHQETKAKERNTAMRETGVRQARNRSSDEFGKQETINSSCYLQAAERRN
jgi:hypothetical protein